MSKVKIPLRVPWQYPRAHLISPALKLGWLAEHQHFAHACLLVDDAIVVVENVERVMHEQNVDARQATLISMQETPNVPNNTTGTAIAGIKVARQLCKNKNMTIMTRTIAYGTRNWFTGR
jgi:hypothetical protein